MDSEDTRATKSPKTGDKRKAPGRILRVTDATEQTEVGVYLFDIDDKKDGVPAVLRHILTKGPRVSYFDQCDGYEDLVSNAPEDCEDEAAEILDNFFNNLPDENRYVDFTKIVNFDYEIGLVAC